MNEPQETLHLLSELRDWSGRDCWDLSGSISTTCRTYTVLESISLIWLWVPKAFKETAPSGCLLNKRSNFSLKSQWRFGNILYICQLLKIKMPLWMKTMYAMIIFSPFYSSLFQVCAEELNHTSIFECQPIYLHHDIRKIACLCLHWHWWRTCPKPSAVNHQADMLTGWMYSYVQKKERSFPYVFRYKHLKEAHRETGGEKTDILRWKDRFLFRKCSTNHTRFTVDHLSRSKTKMF